MSSSTSDQGSLFIIAAPSGGGKTSLVNRLLKSDSRLVLSISHTTRPARPGEVDGRHYNFVSEAEFRQMERKGVFLEHARVFDHYYGTNRHSVALQLEQGHDVILEIDWQGARQVRESMPDAISIFILPPSVTELERRLRDRKTDSDEVIARRLSDALGDMSHWNEFDFAIINDDLEKAVGQLEAVLAGDGETSRVGHSDLDAAVLKVIRS